MTGLRARIRAGVSFIHDPVPRVDRPKKALEPEPQRSISGPLDFGFDLIDWPFGASNPPGPSSPPLYNWATRFAWPRDGFG